ncbi:PREDICTED: dual specificity protein phosphatase 18-like isoform X1 [Propithecus coquereli]|uniref:dual specificity protein phosphatase 18-like isoform X1 n=1 Tax=Propithecus coquereli TaxID=379532 RepID=UPI00063EF669|nr:PREDICTED: dual specificity protein phosphatase 18-like isoform X1 [Propithecus coquereli]
MTTPLSSMPSQAARQASIRGLSRITTTLYLSGGVAANNKLMLSSNNITTVINVSVEVVNTPFKDIQYLQVPVVDAPSSRLCEFFDPIADYIHDVEMKQGRTLLHCVAGVSRSAALCLAYLMKYHSMSLLAAHTWTKSCRPIIRPNNGFWEQLIHYEFKLFSKNTVHMIDSPIGRIPDIYEKDII